MLPGYLLSRVLVLLTAATAAFAVAPKQPDWGSVAQIMRRQNTPPDGAGDPFVNLPQQCEQTCQPLFDFQCEAIECECTNDNAQLLASCLNCVVGAGGDESVAQASMDAFVQFCAQNNVTVNPIDITPSPTGSASGTGGSSSPTGTETTTGSGTTTGTETTTQPPETTTTGTTTTGTITTETTSTGTDTTTTEEPTNTGDNLNGARMAVSVPFGSVEFAMGGILLVALGVFGY